MQSNDLNPFPVRSFIWIINYEISAKLHNSLSVLYLMFSSLCLDLILYKTKVILKNRNCNQSDQLFIKKRLNFIDFLLF